jgi:hypothetical protein
LSISGAAAQNADNGLLSIIIHPHDARTITPARAVWLIEPGEEQQIEGSDSMAPAVQDFKHPVAAGTARHTPEAPFRQDSSAREPAPSPDRDRRSVFVGTNATCRPATERRSFVVTMAGLAG